MTTRIKLRRDTKANWADINPILAAGEQGLESDTRRIKIGDGVTAWSGLQYTFGDLEVTDKTINGELGVNIASQDPETWISTVNARFNWAGTDGVAYDSSGNLYLSGWQEYGYDVSGSGTGESFLVKFDSQGQVVWTKYIGTDMYNTGGGVVVDSDDNVVQIAASWNETRIIVSKFTSDGALVWQKTYNDTNLYAEAYALAVDSNNDLVFAGQRRDPDHTDSDGVFVTKILGSTGAVSWSKTIGRDYQDTWQPSLAIDGDDNIIFAGMENYDNDGQATIVKLTSSGSPVWSKTLRNPEGEYNGYELTIGSLDADADGNIYFIGSYEVPNFVIELDGDYGNGRAGLLLKMNSNGVVQWSRISGPGDCSDLGAQVAYKAGKVYATYQTERPYYKNDSGNNPYTTQQIILACYDAVSGQLLWGNNFGPEVLWGYSNPNGNPDNDQDTSTFSGKLIAVHGDYLAVAGQAGLYSRAEDNETRSYAFLAQLPLDGSEMDLAGWTYKKTRHKSQYAAIESENFSDLDLNNTTDIEVSASNEFTPSNTATNVVIKLLASGANQWDFKPNGDLALPVGGNIEISRAAQGSINVVGHFNINNFDGIGNYFNSVTTDADGNQYYVGMWNWHNNNTSIAYNQMPLVVKVNAQGEVEWKSLLGNSYPTDSYDGVEGAARTVAYDPASGHIVVVCNDSGEGNDSQMLIVDIDVNTGKVVEDHRYSSASGIYANGIAINTLGERFITGSIQSPDNIVFTVTNAMIASTATIDTIMVPVEVFGEEEIPNRYRTDGWTLQGVADVNYVDRYVDFTGTVRQGSGASFDVIANDGDPGVYTVTVNTSGTNYLVDHQIKILGTDLGGATPDNDLTVTVASTTETAILTVTSSGASAGSTSTTYTVTGTNYNVGSGFAIIVDVDNNTATNNMSVLRSSGGTNYVVGDVITFPGTQFGGTSTATDIVITALQVGGLTGDIQSGEDSGYAITQRGVSPRTYVRMQFNGADFTNTSTTTYSLLHYRTADSFLAKFVSTATTSTNLVWAKVIAKSNYDYGVAVDYDSEGNLYWASDIYDEETVDSNVNYERRPVVTKMSSTGTVLWSKSYSTDGGEGNVIGLQVDSEDRVFIGMTQGDFNGNEYSTVVKRLEKDGTAQWTTKFLLDDGSGSQGGLALDNDDNAYVTAVNYDGNDNFAWTAKLDCKDGREIWQQEFRHENYDIYHGFSWRSNSIATDGDKYYISGWTNDGNEGNALAAALPADGSANDTVHGPFSVIESTYNNDGGEGTGGLPGYITRTYTVSTATDQFTLVTDRDTIQSWMESGPTTNYTVYTKSDAGIVFGDGTVQTTSGSGLPQIRHRLFEKEFKLKLSDAGKHHYIRNQDMIVVIPRYSEVQFPVGTMITIVNISSGYVKVAIDKQDDRTTLYCPATDGSEGGDSLYHGFEFEDQGGGNFITLLKVEESYSNGTRWIINGNNASGF